MVPVDSLIGAYRYHADAISNDVQNYHQHCDEIIARELNATLVPKWPGLVRKVDRGIRRVPVVRGLWRLVVSKNLYNLKGPDWAPAIVSRNNKWIMLDE